MRVGKNVVTTIMHFNADDISLTFPIGKRVVAVDLLCDMPLWRLRRDIGARLGGCHMTEGRQGMLNRSSRRPVALAD